VSDITGQGDSGLRAKSLSSLVCAAWITFFLLPSQVQGVLLNGLGGMLRPANQSPQLANILGVSE
jgi:hypothetical protein